MLWSERKLNLYINKSCDVNNIITITWNREINHSIASIGGIINRSEYKHASIRKSISRRPGKNKQRAFAAREETVYEVLLKTLDFKLKIAFWNKLLRSDTGREYMYITHSM